MRLERLQVQQYRNLQQACLEPSPFLTVICGENGQGKTNLLESIWMLCGAKSFRGAKELELIQKGASWSRLAADIADERAQKDAPPLRIEIAIKANETGSRASRTAKKNGADCGRAANLAGEFPCVVFAPGHIDAICGSPEGRRRFIDAALCQLYPGYMEQLHRYARALQQKNAYLKAYKAARAGEMTLSAELLDSFDEQLAAAGALVCEKRRGYIEALHTAAAVQYAGISHSREALQLAYRPSVEDGWDAAALADAIRQARSTDIRAGFCTAGPHRDDMELSLCGEDARVYASQGQRRSIVLSAKIAELELVGRVTGLVPVLLLDDVLSELDAGRQDYLLNRIQDKQVFITCCSPEIFSKTGGRIVTVQNGRVMQDG